MLLGECYDGESFASNSECADGKFRITTDVPVPADLGNINKKGKNN